MIDYKYNEEGLVAAVVVAGETYEIDDKLRHSLPGRSLPETRTAQTAVKSTVEDLKQSYSAMTDSKYEDSSILIDVEATHGGYFNQNRYFYLTSGMRSMVDTWTQDGGRPYIVGHDMSVDPRGRIQDARFVPTMPEMGFHALDVRVGHEKEIEMIIDGRALHVSVGSDPVDTVGCSCCGHDIYHDGNTPQRYQLDREPDLSWLKEEAPGVFGKMGMTNEDFWDVTEDDGTWTALCRHMRKADAPVGGDETHEIGWYLHAQDYNELSRVNSPADVNEETGEYAHIREIKSQTDDLDQEAADRLLIDKLSKVEDEVTERANYQVAREKDLYRPGTAQKAADIADNQGYGVMFDAGLWKSINARLGGQSMQDKVAKYHEQGGRFVDTRPQQRSTAEMTVKEALQADPKEFGAWIRANDFDRDADRMLNRMYLSDDLELDG